MSSKKLLVRHMLCDCLLGRAQALSIHGAGKGKKPEDKGPKLDFSQFGKAGGVKGFPGVQQFTTFAVILAAMALYSSTGRSDAKEVSFQEFKTQLLAKGLVEKLEVSNKALVKVYIRSNSTGRWAQALVLCACRLAAQLPKLTPG